MATFQVPDLGRLTEAVKDILTVRRVFGEPVETDGALVIPVARVSGGSGVGFGSGSSDRPDSDKPDDNDGSGGRPGSEEGGGGGFGVNVKADGIYLIRDGEAQWVPALDFNRLAASGMMLGLAAIVAWVVTSRN
ncbi:sporulation protein [Corynebacterium hylobatis]|uniref:Sporulation protein n=1 Tax=Corynebacterium hylobatis TaxID=1859290 RepID=A0A3S0HJB4_9CORY|nr:spore germination protein GerW family protein [Corynebacterium hylobatis]RSZ66048.1 sporulation protein [Corynebacterium hylobatis]